MAKPKHIILTEDGVITQEALLAYAEGQLSVEETMQIEKLLKGDPFAQDALDGMRSAGIPGEMGAVVTTLKTQLREKAGVREKKKKSIDIHWATYAYAAMIVGILIGLGFVMIHFISSNDQRIAMNKEIPQAQERIPVTENKQQIQPAPDTAQTNSTGQSVNGTVTKDTAAAMSSTTNTGISAPVTGNSTTGGNQATGYNQQIPATTISAAPVMADRKANAPAPATAASSQSKPIIINTGRADEAAYSVDGHDLAKGKEVKSQNYKSTTEADFEANRSEQKNPESVNVSAAKAKKESKADKAAVTLPDQLRDARALFDAADYKSAAKKYSDILSNQPDNADALYFGGISDYFNGKSKPAEKNFDKLLKANLYVDGSKWYKASILIDKGKKDEARPLLRDLINTNSSFKDRAVKKYEEIAK